MDSLIIGAIFGSVVALVLYMYGSNRDAATAVASKPPEVVSFTTTMLKADVFRAVILFAQMSELNAESMDETQGKIILGADMNMMKNHNGYWLAVYISENSTGATVVEVGIQSKAFQAGWVLRPIRDKALNNIKAAVIAQGGRVA